MWNFQSKRNALRERMLLAAPEANPHDFVRRYLLAKPRPTLIRVARLAEMRAHEPQDRRKASRRLADPLPVPAIPV
jgi:hypothetical protein